MPHIPQRLSWSPDYKPGWSGEWTAKTIGYQVVKRCGIVWRRTPIKRIVLNLDFPAVFTSQLTGRTYRTEMVFSSDQGSIPAWAQSLSIIPGLDLRRDTWEIEYGAHDNMYANHGGMVLTADGRWSFKPMPRAEVDLLLWEGLKLGGANAVERNAIFDGVRIGGWLPWSRHKDCPV